MTSVNTWLRCHGVAVYVQGQWHDYYVAEYEYAPDEDGNLAPTGNSRVAAKGMG
jgi:hypothetical protein